VSNLRDVIGRWLRPPARKSVFQECLESGRATLGPGSYGEPEVYVFPEDYSTKLRIGAYSSIAAGTRILLGGEHHIDWVTTSPLRILNGLPGAGKDGHPLSKGDVTIGNDVWIGMGAMILSGVTIGNGAVIGAGTVVARDVPPFAVVAGNPASIIRFRFSSDIQEALERIAWWSWPHQRVLGAVDLLCSDGGVERFVQLYDK